jgi:hypothetical protein
MSVDSHSVDSGSTRAYGLPAGRPGLSLPSPDLKPKSAWRLIPAIDQHPGCVAYVQRLPGRLLVFFAAIVLAALLNWLGMNFLIAPLAVACACMEQHRRIVMSLATWLLLYQSGFLVDVGLVERVAAQEGVADQISQGLLHAGMLVLVFSLFSGLLISWHRIVAVPAFRRPTLGLIGLFLGLVLVAESPVARGVPRVFLWSFLMTLLPYLWFLAYALAGASNRERPPFWQHLGMFHPFWGSTLTPFGKGLAYLQKFEAKTPEELAVTQLKGLKLAAWTLLLASSLSCFSLLIHGYLGLPSFDDTFLHYLAGTAYPHYICWASLLASFVEDVLYMSVFGGAIVATARLAGFRLLRNTWRPLEATTLADFWNRYYFYYKELLVDHFFYPAFLRYFRNHRRLRIFFATFSAACVGNLIFHFIRDIHFVADMGLWNAVVGDQSHAFYTFVLAMGVSLSQMRAGTRKAPKGWLRGHVFPCLWVVGFFCILHVFDAPVDREHSIWQRGQFLLYLMGTDTWK